MCRLPSCTMFGRFRSPSLSHHTYVLPTIPDSTGPHHPTRFMFFFLLQVALLDCQYDHTTIRNDLFHLDLEKISLTMIDRYTASMTSQVPVLSVEVIYRVWCNG
ncbi:hypothetical protein HYPSUDRAFT_296893 [Hypholoma sublateritium FD-334 SS-4]|uniref:Uncharacterized protein n=1 Tax=Hypholoma sublateritium (strain FD-334 SS-4) TaxID=945553 RepID=A0A0D2NI55_HYPSF|nr:hypothetical protein HYPSUDRAFT_296893 [Hypholoma sublateritium FD-334 SS-4]